MIENYPISGILRYLFPFSTARNSPRSWGRQSDRIRLQNSDEMQI